MNFQEQVLTLKRLFSHLFPYKFGKINQNEAIFDFVTGISIHCFAEGEAVEVDESLFQDLDDLELADEDLEDG